MLLITHDEVSQLIVLQILNDAVKCSITKSNGKSLQTIIFNCCFSEIPRVSGFDSRNLYFLHEPNVCS